MKRDLVADLIEQESALVKRDRVRQLILEERERALEEGELGVVAERVARRLLFEAAVAARQAKLPRGYRWGKDARESFEFGKERAAAAVLALGRKS